MSLSGGINTLLDAAVLNASAFARFTLSAGNAAKPASLYSPARANNANRIFTISAMNKNDVFAYFSNYGNPPVDYAAPGVSVLSLYKDNGTATMSGTSMSAPHFAGILLHTGGYTTDGTVSQDKDRIADPIAVLVQ